MDLNAVITWHRFKVEKFEKYEMTDAQLKIYLRELNRGTLPNLGKTPSRGDIIKVLLDHAAKGMSFYDEHQWWVAKQVMKRDEDRIIMHVDIPTLNRFSTNLKSLFLTAANVPESLTPEEKMAIIVCPDPYADVGPSLYNSISKIDPTITEWIAIGKWLDYEIPTKYRFLQDIWRIHIEHLFNDYPIDMIVSDQPIIISRISNISNQPSTLPKTSDATTNQRFSRPGGVDEKEGGAAGGTCSSPGGRSSAFIGQQRESSVVQLCDGDHHINWNNLLPFETPSNQRANQTWISLRNAGNCQVLSAVSPKGTNRISIKPINSL
jgi:hypothetical protein